MVAFASGYWFMMFTMFVGLLAGIYGSLFSKHEFVFVVSRRKQASVSVGR